MRFIVIELDLTCDCEFVGLHFKYDFVMVGLYLHVEILEVSIPLSIFKMPWVDKFLGP